MEYTENEEYFCQVSAEDGSTYYLLTGTHNGGFNMSLSSGTAAWTGSLSEDDLDALCAKTKMDFDTFLEQSKKALTRQNMGRLHCVYQTKKMSNTLRFTWKKHVPSEDIKFTLGSVDLQQKTDPSMVTMAIFQHCIERSTDLNQQITSLQSDNERLASERAKAVKRLEKCVSAKEEMEKDLYGKFVAVLNSKKDKIREMLEDVSGDHATAESDDEPGPSSSRSATTKRPRKRSPSPSPRSAHHTDSEYDTDEDIKPTHSVSQASKRVKKEVDDAGDDSLLLDDGSSGATPVTARRRKRGVDKKATPAKPVIPKGTSTPRTSSTDSRGRRSSMRKSASNASSDNIDPDDLLLDL